MARKDLPSPNAPNFLARVREEVHALLGKLGSGSDRALTLRDAIESGVIVPGPGGSLIPGPGAGAAEEPDLTPPPQPDAFTATGAISHFLISQAQPFYTQGHGHSRTVVYGAQWVSGPLPVFADAVELDRFAGTVRAVASNPATTWHLWIKWESNDGVLSATPAGGTNGLAVTTGQDVALLLDALAGQITSSQLAASLSTPIGKIPALESGLAQEIIDRAQALANEASDRAQALANEASDRAAAIQAAADAAAAGLAAEIGNRVAAIQQVDMDLRNELATADAVVVSSLTSAFQSADAATLASANSYTFSKTEINTAISAMGSQLTTNYSAADAATLATAQNFTYSRSAIDAADAATLSTLRSEFAAADSSTLATAQNFTYSRATIDGAIASSASTLRSQLTGGSTATDLNLLSSGLLYQMRETSAAQDAALSQQITLLSAGAGEQFDYSNIWYFDSGLESWTTNGTGSTLSAVSGWLRLVSNSGTLTDRYFVSPDNLGINGYKYPQVRLRVRKVGSPAWEGTIYFNTTTDATFNVAKSLTVAEPTYDANGIGLVTFNMPAGWTGATIRQIRFDASTSITPTDYYELDWVAVGRPSPGASSAQLTALQSAMVTADDAMAQDITALEADLTTLTGDVATKASASALSALDARVTSAEGVNSSQSTSITNLNNSLTTTNNTVATKADASALSSLDTRVTTAEGTVTSHGTRLNTLESTVNNPTTGVAATASALDVVETLVNHATTGVTATATKAAVLEANIGAVVADPRVSLLADQNMSMASAWRSHYGTDLSPRFISITDGSATITVCRSPTPVGAFWNYSKTKLTIDPARTYRWRARIRRVDGDGTNYVTWWRNLVGTYGNIAFPLSEVPNNTWAIVTRDILGSTFGDTSVSPGFALNHTSPTTGYCEIDWLEFTDVTDEKRIDTKADASALSTLSATVTNQGNTITTQGNSITALQNSLATTNDNVATKADASALNAMDTRVTATESTNTSQATSITNLTSSLSTTNTNVSTAQTTANNAATAAANAQTTANSATTSAATANTLLTDIASDSKLTPVEKQSVRSEWNVIAAEKAGINTQASTFGITTENTTYNNAFQTLANYLNAGTAWSSGVPSWISDANLSATTTIVGATFRSNWQSLYTARTALLNAIAAKAKTLADAAQATANAANTLAGTKADASALSSLDTRVTTAEGTVTSHGTRLNTLESTVNNPTTGVAATASALDVVETLVNHATTGVTATATKAALLESKLSNQRDIFTETWDSADPLARWQNYSGAGGSSIVSASDTVGGKAMRVGDNAGDDQAWLVHQELIPFDPNKLYRMRVKVRRPNGDGAVYIGWAGMAADGVTQVNASGAASVFGNHYHCISAGSPGTGWTEFSGYTKGYGATAGTTATGTLAAPGKMHPNVRYLRAMVLVNYASKTGITEVGPLSVDDAEIKEVESGLNTAVATKADASALATTNTNVTNLSGTVTALSTDYNALKASVENPTTGLTSKASVTYVDQAEADAVSAAAAYTQTLETRLNRVVNYMIRSSGSSATGLPWVSGIYTESGVLVNGGARSYCLVVLNGSTGAVISSQNYDVYGLGATQSGRDAAALASALNALTSDKVVVVFTRDEPNGSRLTGGLEAAMYRCGASRAVFGAAAFQYRSAYILVGMPGIGEGGGVERYAGAVSADPNAFCEYNLQLINGRPAGLGGNALNAAIQVEAATRATQTGELYAQYTVKTDVGGLVSGYGLASTATNATPTSAFGVQAGQFFVGPPAVAQATAPTANLYKGFVWRDTANGATRYWTGSAWSTTPQTLPFVVQAVPTTVNGVAVPAGMYAESAFIMNGTITNAKIANLAVDDAKIANLSVSKLTAGSIAVGQYIQSTGYVAGSSGWRINGDGTAEFSGVVVRGTIFASQGAIGGWTIGSNYLQSTTYVLGESGTRLNSDGTGQIGGVTVYSQGLGAGSTAYNTGDGAWLGRDGKLSLRSASGSSLTFDGSRLKAQNADASRLLDLGATGAESVLKVGAALDIKADGSATFAGALNAAGGTFSGVLTADAIAAVSTINIAGNAVTTHASASGNGSCSTTITIPQGASGSVVAIAVKDYAPHPTSSNGTKTMSLSIAGNVRTSQVRKDFYTGNQSVFYYYYPELTVAHAVQSLPAGTHTISVTQSANSDPVTLAVFASWR